MHGITLLGLPTDATPAQVLLCSVSGDIFPKADDEQARAQLGLQQQQQRQQGAEVRQAYLGALLGVVLPWVAPADRAMHTAAANSEAELLDACRSACLPLCLLSHHRNQYADSCRLLLRTGNLNGSCLPGACLWCCSAP